VAPHLLATDMTIYPHPARKQAHLHLPTAHQLTSAVLIDQQGKQVTVELHPHGSTHYMLSWKQPLSTGYYGVYVQTQDGKRFHQALRID